MSVCTAGLFPSRDLAQVTHPQLQVESPGPPSGSVAFFAAKGEQFSQCQCRWLKNQLSCPWFVHVIIYSSLMKFCNSCAGMQLAKSIELILFSFVLTTRSRTARCQLSGFLLAAAKCVTILQLNKSEQSEREDHSYTSIPWGPFSPLSYWFLL